MTCRKVVMGSARQLSPKTDCIAAGRQQISRTACGGQGLPKARGLGMAWNAPSGDDACLEVGLVGVGPLSGSPRGFLALEGAEAEATGKTGRCSYCSDRAVQCMAWLPPLGISPLRYPVGQVPRSARCARALPAGAHKVGFGYFHFRGPRVDGVAVTQV